MLLSTRKDKKQGKESRRFRKGSFGPLDLNNSNNDRNEGK
jgi:hypothetical protein